MSFVKVKVMMPPTEEGNPPVERELNLNQDAILFVVKPNLMEPVCVTRDTRMVLRGVDTITLPKFEIPEGGDVWIGPKNVIFWHATDNLGHYVVGMPNAAQVVVKATRQALEMAFGTPAGGLVL